MPGWRDRDTDMKVLWPGVAAARGSRARQAALNMSTIWCRSVRNWSGPTARNPQSSSWNRVRASRASPRRTAQSRRRAPPMRRGGWCCPGQSRGCYLQPRHRYRNSPQDLEAVWRSRNTSMDKRYFKPKSHTLGMTVDATNRAILQHSQQSAAPHLW
jgi:hypothetical protein